MLGWIHRRWKKPPVETYVEVEGFIENQDIAWWKAFKEHCKRVNFHYDSEMWTCNYCPCLDCTAKLTVEKERLRQLEARRQYRDTDLFTGSSSSYDTGYSSCGSCGGSGCSSGSSCSSG